MVRFRRVVVFGAMVLLSLALLGGMAITAEEPIETDGEFDPYPGDTLVTVQAYGWFGNYNGEAFIVTPEGERTWEYRPPDAAMFDGELLENGNVMVSYGQYVPNAECPTEWQDKGAHEDHCVKNVVEEIDRDTNERVWAYTWYDRFIHYHEVHDADRLESGETAIIDMGQHRTFTVDQDGEITWEWSAIEHLDEGTAFWEEHVEGTPRENHAYTGGDQDWTHMNDVDQLPNGNFLMSIRNFDVLIEVDPQIDEIVDVIGEPGNHDIMHEQHDPHYLAEHGNVIVADSENDRIIEYDVETMDEIWRYEGPSEDDRLAWARDADRLPNGNTLIADSRNFRVLEVDPNGDVVWGLDLTDERGIVYNADRLGPNESLGEEPQNVPPGDDLDARYHQDGVLALIRFAESWIGFVLPHWVGLPGVLAILVGVVGTAGLAREGVSAWRNDELE